jgi:hypothetical protein
VHKSAYGTKQTYPDVCYLTAFGRKADLARRRREAAGPKMAVGDGRGEILPNWQIDVVCLGHLPLHTAFNTRSGIMSFHAGVEAALISSFDV